MIRVRRVFCTLMISAFLCVPRARFSIVYTQTFNGPYLKWLVLGLNLGVYFRVARVHTMEYDRKFRPFKISRLSSDLPAEFTICG